MRLRFFGNFDPRFSFILLALVVLGVIVWPTTKAIGKRTSPSNSKQQLQSATLKGKMVIQRVHLANQPVEIVELTARGKRTRLNSEIDADDDWLNGLTLKFKNMSNKTISSIYLTLVLPDTEVNGNPQIGFPIRYGAAPPGAPQGIGAPIEPNQTTDITITEQTYNILKPNIESRISLKDLKQLHIVLDLIIFTDDTAWSAGETMRRDPNNPRKWLPIQ